MVGVVLRVVSGLIRDLPIWVRRPAPPIMAVRAVRGQIRRQILGPRGDTDKGRDEGATQKWNGRRR